MTAKSPRPPTKSHFEARRLAILAEAERLCVPGFMTPTWQRLYGAKAAR